MTNALKSSEIAILKLRSLYESRGYSHFKMSQFEEYDIYAANKDFLGGESIITFTDTNGCLMALKPDVTMSIINNSKEGDGLTEKLYYNENVYRVSRGTHQLREIMQSGLECIGEIDLYNTCEVISLAARSLELFDRDCVLDISHMGIVSGLIDGLSVSDSVKKEVISCIGQKNAHGIKAALSLSPDDLGSMEKIIRLIELNPEPDKAVSELRDILGDKKSESAISELESVIGIISQKTENLRIRLDFSVVQDMTYYNGIVFQGFIDGIPEKVLSGGRYDLLMRRIGKTKGAIGFGINVELLERLFDKADDFDADIALIYSDADSAAEVFSFADKLSSEGKSVRVAKKISGRAKYRKVLHFGGPDNAE